MENFLEKIQNRTLTKWKNQLIGEFKISKEHLNVFYLRFIECEIDVNNNNNFFYKHNRYDNSKMPIIAKGFVVYYISRYGKQSKEDICNDYFFSNLKNQKNEREYIQVKWFKKIGQ